MQEDVFAIARSKIGRGIIEEYFAVNGSYWKRNEFWTLNPYRGDKHIGSFHISIDGQWFDHATNEGGDFINLVARSKNISDLEAAKEIAGGDYQPAPKKTSKTRPREREIKVQPKYPIPEKETDTFIDYARTDFYQRKWGKYVCTFAIRNVKNEILYFVVRYESAPKNEDEKKQKNTIPFYLGVDNKYYAKLPWDEKIPMYGVQKLKTGCKVIIVEGEKKAIVPCGDYVLISPVGGSAKFKYADVEPLKLASEVIVWPDADEPGRKAAEEIIKLIPCENKSILVIKDKPKSWDICDLTNEGGDPVQFIETCEREIYFDEPPKAHEPEIKEPPPSDPPQFRPDNDNPYFRCLGWDDEYHYFMLKRNRIIMLIGKQSFTSSKLGAIAPLNYFEERSLLTPQGNIKVSQAQDHIQNMSNEIGRFNMDKVRGSGVWIDGKHKIVNTGRELFVDGNKIGYDDFPSNYIYVSSEKYFGKIEGTPANAKQGEDLLKLFEVQKWTTPQACYATLGWTLISNFGGCLNWRPHIFINGKIGSGKSWLLDNVIKPIVGDYAHYGSGADTEPGIRRSIMQEPRPVVLDEMKIKTKKDESNISNILNLIRNSSSDASAKITMASANGGTINFNVRSPFCLSSDQVPFDSEDLTSRIIQCELETPHSSLREKHERTKAEASAQYLPVLNNPDIFRIRIFQKLQDILDDIYWLQHDELALKTPEFTFFNTNRKRANWAPLLAVIYHLTHDGKLSDNVNMATQWLFDTVGNWRDDQNISYGDEDGIIYALIETSVRVETEDMTIGELLIRSNDDLFKKYLGRIGIKVNKKGELCIATNSEKIKQILKDKHYAQNYDAQLKRNELCINSKEKSKNVRFAEIGNRMARLFDFEKFKEKYIGNGEEDSE